MGVLSWASLWNFWTEETGNAECVSANGANSASRIAASCLTAACSSCDAPKTAVPARLPCSLCSLGCCFAVFHWSRKLGAYSVAARDAIAVLYLIPLALLAHTPRHKPKSLTSTFQHLIRIHIRNRRRPWLGPRIHNLQLATPILTSSPWRAPLPTWATT